MTHLVFVYGTLKHGFPNFATNTGVRRPGTYVTRQRFPLYIVGERQVPCLLNHAGEGQCVVGEVYEVDDAGLRRMDVLEQVGEPDGYERVEIDVALVEHPAQALAVQIYLKPAGSLGREHASVGPVAEYTLDHAAHYRPRAR